MCARFPALTVPCAGHCATGRRQTSGHGHNWAGGRATRSVGGQTSCSCEFGCDRRHCLCRCVERDDEAECRCCGVQERRRSDRQVLQTLTRAEARRRFPGAELSHSPQVRCAVSHVPALLCCSQHTEALGCRTCSCSCSTTRLVCLHAEAITGRWGED